MLHARCKAVETSKLRIVLSNWRITGCLSHFNLGFPHHPLTRTHVYIPTHSSVYVCAFPIQRYLPVPLLITVCCGYETGNNVSICSSICISICTSHAKRVGHRPRQMACRDKNVMKMKIPCIIRKTGERKATNHRTKRKNFNKMQNTGNNPRYSTHNNY